MEKYYAQLSKMALFHRIAYDDIPPMLTCLKAVKKTYVKDSYIKSEGDPADFIGIVLEGTIQIIQDDYDGKRNITAAFGPMSMFAEAFACADVESLPVSILAASNCTILFLSKNQILHPCENTCVFHGQLIQNLLKIVAQKNMLLSQKLQYISHKTTKEKLMAYLTAQAKLNKSDAFTIPYDRQALADYLGVERSAMSAEISKLKAMGIIETRRSYFKLLKG